MIQENKTGILYRVFLAAVLICFVTSCSRDGNTVPAHILPAEKMVEVMVDVQITESVILYKNSKGDQSEKNAPEYYQHIFNRHSITEKQFRESFAYYTGKEELMDKIYEEVLTEISKRQAEMSAK